MTITENKTAIVEREPTADDGDVVVDDHIPAIINARATRRLRWERVVAYGLLPGLALTLAVGGAYLKWTDSSVREPNRRAAKRFTRRGTARSRCSRTNLTTWNGISAPRGTG